MATTKILAINCGSSTLKFRLVDADDEHPDRPRSLASGIVDRIGTRGNLDFTAARGPSLEEESGVQSHGDAARKTLDWLRSEGILEANALHAVGHRVVHGGDQFTGPTLIDDRVMEALRALSALAPLHNAPAIEAIEAAREDLGPNIPQVAVFDTAFHRTLPDRASTYAIPRDLTERHHIRRYGFHGLAHRYMAERYVDLARADAEKSSLITLQLGNGCSAAAIRGGRSMDTSMGLTPLEGLMMGTRSGDVDPSLLGFLARRERTEVDRVEDWLNTRSGLLGVSGLSRDMRTLLDSERQGNRRAALAVEIFCYRVKKYIGAYLAALGGADALVFGGGIGENAPEVRSRICAGMEWCGIALDPDRNDRARGIEGKISTDEAPISVYVIPVDETKIIVHDTVRCIAQNNV